jgi:hypothetical protein
MMQGFNATSSLNYLMEFEILDLLMKFPSTCTPSLTSEQVNLLSKTSLQAVRIMETLLLLQRDQNIFGLETIPEEKFSQYKGDSIYAAMLLPFD